MPITEIDSQGTVNALFRIGDKFLARFPLEPGDVTVTRRWLESEAQAARELLGCTRFLTPEPVALGEPGSGYPLPWSVQTWLPGTVATADDPGESVAFAHDLAEFIRGCAQSIRAAGRSTEGAEEASCDRPIRGWRTASSAADSSWTFHSFGASGQSCGAAADRPRCDDPW
jgi:aminoglycoside phosphotransferase (APT) family kinase protein